MQTHTTSDYLTTSQGREADAIIRSCVHCGFCTATCPTYQLLGDELDGPRGRIYLMKQVLEGKKVTNKTQTHLDRCLSCRSCETTCPSGVQYGRLVDIGCELVDSQVIRSPVDRIKRFSLRKLLPYPQRFSLLLRVGQWLKPILPLSIKQKIPARQNRVPWPENNQVDQSQQRKMLVVQGCVQSVATPNTNSATANILHKLGIELIAVSGAGCCGAISQHLSAPKEALAFMRRNIDVWWPMIEKGAEAIVITASGGGVVVKEYGHLLKHDTDYADKAKKVSELAKDISEVLTEEDIALDRISLSTRTIAFQSPCTLQHGQQLDGVVESLLKQVGFILTTIDDAHLCCGSAGTYSIFQKTLSQQLLDNKLIALQKHRPELIVTANVGCQLHLQAQANVPVKHWVELLDDSFV